MIDFYFACGDEAMNDITNTVISASCSYQVNSQQSNVQLVALAKKMLNKTLPLGQR
ncbi:hypothetical protein [Colwellia ponticola]|uniref:hypothetical protein n=1 Tax=Colwellia ponticola TaxID=2304625 RepID=UPI000FF3D4FC|nr:hypothetical protein [Colwellia ponticola]RGP39343.1 hypothetical protein BPTFM16_03018 [Altererythrobacter insulae]